MSGLLGGRMGQKKVLGVLAGTDTPVTTIGAWASLANAVVAADGAANRLLAFGIQLDCIVGDLDSLDPLLKESKIEIVELKDQECTDCDKLLAFVRDRYPESDLQIAGLEGDRFDHVLASTFSIAKEAPNAGLILRDGLGRFVVAGKEAKFTASPGGTVSLIPLMPCRGVAMSGVEWAPKQDLSPDGNISISNRATHSEIVVSLESGLALFISQGDSSTPTWQ
jgi:thiamine pyrophosphokinase